jgi:hypothetical protein
VPPPPVSCVWSFMQRLRRPHLLLVVLALVGIGAVGMLWQDRSLQSGLAAGMAVDIGDSVVIVEVLDRRGRLAWSAVGFLVEPGHIITNRHCIEGGWGARVVLPSGRRYPVRGILADGGDLDVVLLDVSIPEWRGPRLRWAAEDPDIDEPVWLVQRDVETGELFRSAGRVLAITSDPYRLRVIHASCAGDFGASGSPLVNRAGEVVGVVHSGSGRHEGISRAAPVSNVRSIPLETTMPLAAWWAPQDHPGWLDAHTHLQSAYWYSTRGDNAEAIRHAQAVLLYELDNWRAHALLAGLMFTQKLFSDAAWHAQQWSRVKPEHEAAWATRALAEYRSGNGEKARASFRKYVAMRTDPEEWDGSLVDDVDHCTSCTWAALCAKEGLLEESLEAYHGAIVMRSDCLPALAGVAQVAMRLGYMETAQTWIDRVAALNRLKGRRLAAELERVRAGEEPELVLQRCDCR